MSNEEKKKKSSYDVAAQVGFQKSTLRNLSGVIKPASLFGTSL